MKCYAMCCAIRIKEIADIKASGALSAADKKAEAAG